MPDQKGADPVGPATSDEMRAAMIYEEEIAERAARERGDADSLTYELFMRLWPLLKEPVPAAFIQHVPRLEKGKPYESTGIRSVQFQIDRMNNVVTPAGWQQEVEYEQAGKLCHVVVTVGTMNVALAVGESWGGVDRGSSVGNVYKGSYTNAAKRAFAMIGVGHEIYLGTTDLDPDVSREAAEQEGTGAPAAGQALAKQVYERVVDLGLVDRLQLAASHVAGQDVGDCGTKAKAVKVLAALPVEQLNRLDGRLQQIADERASKQEGGAS